MDGESGMEEDGCKCPAPSTAQHDLRSLLRGWTASLNTFSFPFPPPSVLIFLWSKLGPHGPINIKHWHNGNYQVHLITSVLVDLLIFKTSICT